MKRKLKFEDYKNCLEATQFENKVTMQKKIESDTESLKKVLKNNKLILKTQQRFKSQRHNTFTDEINNQMQSMNLIIKECNQLIR